MMKVEVVSYQSHWPQMFEQEAALIKQALGDNCVAIHHIGSTAVPELSAKPIIDMIPVVLDIEKVDQAIPTMQALGYEAKGEYKIPFRRYFQKGTTVRSYHVHIYQQGNSEIDRHVKFRDWMRAHADDRDAYGQLKQELAQKHPNDIMAYCLGKESFVAKIEAKTGFKGFRIVTVFTPREWEVSKAFRQSYFFDKIGVSDPYTWTFDREDHVHFVLYEGTEIVGYVHLQLEPDQRSALRIIAIDERCRGRKLESQFLSLCEKWLKQQGFKGLNLEAPSKVKTFYESNGD